KPTLIILFFLVQIQLSFSQTSKLVNDINSFNFKIYNEIDKKENNIVYSGFSISNALSVVYAGSRGKTATEFETVFNNEIKQDIHKFYKELNQNLLLNREVDILTANALWLQNSYKYEKSYQQIIENNYSAKINKANFANQKGRDKALENINLWVKEKTKDKIINFIKPNMLSEATTLIIINAIYFNSLWDTPFLKEKTKSNQFYTINGDTIETSFLNNELNTNYFEDEKSKVIEIQYKNQKASIILILPKDNYSDFLDKFDINYYKFSLNNLKKDKVTVTIPKFKLEAQYDLTDILKKLGLELAFKSNADFSGITGNKDLHISNIIHKSVIELSEEGTEASSSTAILTTRSTSVPSIPKSFVADHPFIFLIKDNTSNLILFMGVMIKP
ncbi:MAG: serpin family protein, partial [Bacteroidales bacterium]|nr:serpin family protein [Bacteroidales bacterium]